MATGRREARRVLILVALLMLAVLVVWDLLSPESVLRELFRSDPNPRENARQMIESIRDRAN